MPIHTFLTWQKWLLTAGLYSFPNYLDLRFEFYHIGALPSSYSMSTFLSNKSTLSVSFPYDYSDMMQLSSAQHGVVHVIFNLKYHLAEKIFYDSILIVQTEQQ